jgi:hypothetical protein
VPWGSVASAHAGRGPLTDSLHLTLNDGSHLKFLWLRADQAMDLVSDAAERHLGNRFAGLD